MYYIATVHLTDNLAAEMETDTPEVDKLEIDETFNLMDEAVEMETDTREVDELKIDTSEIDETVVETDEVKKDTSKIDEIEKWSKSLKPANVVNWYRLCPNLSGYFYREYLKKVLANTRCPTRIMNNLTENYIERNWPPGISTDTKRTWIKVYNRSLMNSYNCRRLPSTTISKEIVVVLASDNKTMPHEMIDEFGFVMFFGRGGIADKEEIATEMGTDIPEVDDSEINKLNIDQPEKDEELHLINDVIIQTSKLNVNTSEIDEIEKWSNSLKPAKVVYWPCLYFQLSGYYYKDYLKKVLDINGCPTHTINDLAEKYTERNWPPGILSDTERVFSEELMDGYNCRRLSGTTNSKEVVVVLASDNKTMPEDMIDEIGFVMIFNKGGTIVQDDNAVEIATGTTEVDETVQLEHVIKEVYTSDLSELEKWSNTLKPAKVVNWNSLYTNFDGFEGSMLKLLIKNGCPTHIANGLAEKYNNSHWPPGLTNTYRKFNDKLLDSYICRRLSGTTFSEEAVIVFASDNKTMPKEMIDELGFILHFSGAALIGI